MQNKEEFVYTKNLNVGRLFESEAFSKYVPLFLEKSMTMLEVSKESGVSRQTISDQLGLIPEYVEQPAWTSKVKGRPLKLKAHILTYYFSQKLELNEFQTELLDEILVEPAIQRVILRNNGDLGAVLNKTVLTILFLENIATLPSQIKNNMPMEFMSTIFSSILNEQPHRVGRIKRKFEESRFGQNTEELKTFKSALLGFSGKAGLFELTKKFRLSGFEPKASPKDWHLLIQLAMKGELADQILHSEARTKVLNWRRHPKTMKGKFIKKLRNQIGKGV